ncbi:MAG: guanylate kinase [Pseudomonadota bacterium]|nr:guanylate kinase [Pseudomonadota bacterium]
MNKGAHNHASMKTPTVFVISAPSGAGKTSLARALVQSRDDTALAVSHTTRPMRPGEKEGLDYFFVDRQQFKIMVDGNRFLEYAQVFDNFYGTSVDAVESLLAAGKNVLLDIDWQGARVVREKFPGACSIFVLPPSLDALETRLQGRGQDSGEVIARRMREAQNEMSHSGEYLHRIVNDDFDQALAELDALVSGKALPAAKIPV